EVTTAFRYDAYFSAANSVQQNQVADETHTTYQFTVHGNRWAAHYGDPRAPWDTLYASGGTIAKSANGSTPVFQQKKYVDLGAPIPLVTGVAMRTLQAEAALRGNDINGMTGHLNAARTHFGMTGLAVPANLTDAWSVLRYERGATTWLEGRRLWDLSRWYAETGPAHDDFMANRSKCLPVSEDEMQTNPNFP
ncbi:MAG TPA: RagB/SusD family nutrient uptake outer membrane protein, partial [Gemmatimonadaceae bacterium]|nr:RagB/SusD family nutrient uptake outer membrane protein [Gemmatimonadaceae bacterium]